MAQGVDFKALGAAALAIAPSVLRDVAGLAGGAMIAWGAHMVYAPAGWIIGGVEIVAVVIVSALAKAAE